MGRVQGDQSGHVGTTEAVGMEGRAGDSGLGVEPLRCGEKTKRPLGLAKGHGEVGDRFQRRGGPDRSP